MQYRRIMFQYAAADVAVAFFYRHFAGRAINLFQRRDSQRGAIDQLLRQFARAIHQFALADNAVHDSPTQRFFGAHSSAGHHHFVDDSRWQQLRQTQYAAAVRHDAELCFRQREAGVFGADNKVRRQRQLKTAAKRVAVHRGDNRLIEVKYFG
ncbi:hypothetical protein NGUA15_02294 [Salmonella enterica]|nr:hypothetical protein NGUA15_02294 [Salmonella enterica]